MPASRSPRRALSTAAVAAVLLAGATGCGDEAGKEPAAASVPASADASASVSASASASVSAAASLPGAASPSAAASSPAPTRALTPPPARTRLTVAVDTRGGRLALVRGGAPQEFTVTLRNGNTAEYRHLLVALQMEMLVGEPGNPQGSGPGFLLERLDPTGSGGWRPADFRIANDAKPPSLFSGGSALARDAVRVERYRLRATAGGPTGSSPVVVSFIDTDADREVAAHVVLGHTTG
ncbi:hypothetical protein ADK75_29905 [Streptomyces virginiae]|uniref:Lipoprotein n=1 Tax=Streptomyces virginiae TaxID=1961 RepID=A0A0L8M616_STRVG|nr:hypothetical protein [Streptomyces virginiae]KOG45831.1 hypothetical protein ADK75_29905 [Streptomyces virginiae]